LEFLEKIKFWIKQTPKIHFSYELLVARFYVKGSAGYTANEDNDDNSKNVEKYFKITTGEAII
jgi:hypothetical protein